MSFWSDEIKILLCLPKAESLLIKVSQMFQLLRGRFFFKPSERPLHILSLKTYLKVCCERVVSVQVWPYAITEKNRSFCWAAAPIRINVTSPSTIQWAGAGTACRGWGLCGFCPCPRVTQIYHEILQKLNNWSKITCVIYLKVLLYLWNSWDSD